MRRPFIVGATAVAGFVLLGCPPSYPKCNSDEACKDHNEVCVEGQCQECAGDQNCKAGFLCQDHRCVPKECAKDSDCGAGKRCEGGKCRALPCEGDKDCPAGSKCVNHACYPTACKSTDECPSGQECQAGTCVAAGAGAQACSWEPIRFEFNEATLTADAQSRLKDLAECLRKDNASVRLEGHADERGTEEYNLQLSQRRAGSVKKYLTDLGVPGKKLDTIGYGKNKPAVDAHNEAAWAANRRVELNRK